MTYRPYLAERRLQDVIAALQVTGTNERAEDKLESWARKFDDSTEKENVSRWETVFRQHPEFFKIYSASGEQKAALRWRYARRYFDHKENKEVTPAEAEAMGDKRWDLTAKPLDPSQLATLITTAIALYNQQAAEVAAEHQEKLSFRQQILTAGFSLINLIIGAVLGYFLKA